MKAVLLVTTMDTKSKEILFVESVLRESGISAMILDAGIMGESPVPTAISRQEVAEAAGMSLKEVRDFGHEGKALAVMVKGAVSKTDDLHREGKICGVLALGGTMGTTLGAAVMRSLPIGFPKVMISTVATSSNIRTFVGTKDILMLNSVCDISGINRITKSILRNGALAMAGMVKGVKDENISHKPIVVISTMGSTEACVTQLKAGFEKEGKEVVVFHTNGVGGVAMDDMIREEDVEGVVDLSLQEIAAHLMGCYFDAGAARGEAALRKGVPTVIVPGNTDFLVSGPLESTQKAFPDRVLHVHNEGITTMCTTPEEITTIGRRIAEMCRAANGPLSVMVPLGGLSAQTAPGAPLQNPEAPLILEHTLRMQLRNEVPIKALPYHINDTEFTDAIIDTMKTLIDEKQKESKWKQVMRSNI